MSPLVGTGAGIIDHYQHAVANALTNDQPLHVGVTLSCVGGGSDKFWTGVWADTLIAVNFGPHGSEGQHKLHADLTSREAAAAKMWDLLRTKVAKGYTVVDAACLALPADRWNRPDVAAYQMVAHWAAYKRARANNPDRPMRHLDLQGKSPRTPKQGAQVLLAITAPHPTEQDFVAAATATEGERFLPPIVMSRPDVPDAAAFLAALAGTATGVRLTGL